MSRALDLLSDVFGFPEFRPGQEEIVERLLGGNHTLCVMPTGAGKSALAMTIPKMFGDSEDKDNKGPNSYLLTH